MEMLKCRFLKNTFKRKLQLMAVLVIAGLGAMVACDEAEHDTRYRVHLITASPDSALLSPQLLDSIHAIFKLNKLNYDDYQFYYYEQDYLGYYHIRCFQYKNKLKVFTNELSFHFDKNKNFHFQTGEVVGSIARFTGVHMQPNRVVEVFVDVLEKDKFYENEKDKFSSFTYDVEYGYFDLNTGVSDASPAFTKAWKVNRSGYDYPYAYINDSNGSVIYYDDGIRYFYSPDFVKNK